MPRTGENIYKRKDGRWEARYIRYYDENGKAKYGYLYARSYQAVKAKLLSALHDNKQEKKTAEGNHILYTDLLDLWLKTCQVTVKQSSYVKYQDVIEKHIRPVLGKYPVGKISTQLVEQYVQNLILHGRLDGKGGLSPKSVQDIITIVKNTFSYAAYQGYPVSCNLSRLSVKREAREMRVFTRKEQERLQAYLQEDMDDTKLGILLCLYTGIRLGELCALKWVHVCLEEGILKIRFTMQRHRYVGEYADSKTSVFITAPKTKQAVRDIPIPDFLVDILKTMQPADQNAFILSGTAGSFVEPRTMQYRFQRHLQAAGIEKANYHTLRHTFATRCVELGMDVKSLSEILGHANVSITLNRYVHSSLELKRQNMDKLTELL